MHRHSSRSSKNYHKRPNRLFGWTSGIVLAIASLAGCHITHIHGPEGSEASGGYPGTVEASGGARAAFDECVDGSLAACDRTISICAEGGDVPCVSLAATVGCIQGSTQNCDLLAEMADTCETPQICRSVIEPMEKVHAEIQDPEITKTLAVAYTQSCIVDSRPEPCATAARFAEQHIPRATESIATLWKEACERGDPSACSARVSAIANKCEQEGDPICAEGLDAACHDFRNAEACLRVAQVFGQGGELQKMLDHVALACDYGDPRLCKGFVTTLKKQCRNNDGDSCFTLASLVLMPDNRLVGHDPGVGRKLMGRACRLGQPNACSACRSLRCGSGASM